MKYHNVAGVAHKATIMHRPDDRPVNLLLEDVCLPAVAVKSQSLENNITWMQRYADARGVSLAPHGKTTMTPWIFRRQTALGAWAIGVGSAWQASVAMQSGARRVLMVNQLVGRANMQLVSRLKKDYPACHFFCCVDSEANASALSTFFAARGQRLDILIELGVPGGRCGCRSSEEAEALAERVTTLPGLTLHGIELYEGVIHDEDPRLKVEQLLRDAAALALSFSRHQWVKGEMILTGAGSSWYDVVCNIWHKTPLPDGCRLVIRPGCYVTHDGGIYQQAQNAVMARDPIACGLGGDLLSALELIAMVQSVPESGRAVVNFGKRDSAFDAGLPQPVAHYRQGQALLFTPGAFMTVDIMDQHAILTLVPGSEVQVGDILIFTTSHPCLTFDKWKMLFLIDSDYNVLEEMETCF